MDELSRHDPARQGGSNQGEEEDSGTGWPAGLDPDAGEPSTADFEAVEEHELPRRMVIDRRLAGNSILFFATVAAYAVVVGYAFSVGAAFDVGRAADDALIDLVLGPLLLAMTVTIYAAIPYALIVIPMLLGIELLAARGSQASYRLLLAAGAVAVPGLIAAATQTPAVLAAIPPALFFFGRARLPEPELG